MPKGVLSDSTIELLTYKSRNDYPKQLRRVEYSDEELKKNFVFIEPQVSGTVLQVVETTSEDQEVLGRLFRSSEYRLPIRRHFKTSLTNLTSVLTKNLTGSMNPLCLIFYFY